MGREGESYSKREKREKKKEKTQVQSDQWRSVIHRWMDSSSRRRYPRTRRPDPLLFKYSS